MLTPEQQRKLREVLDKYRTPVVEVNQQNQRGLLIDNKTFIPLNLGTSINTSDSIS